MKDTDIRKYAELMKELGLTGLEVTDNNTKVRLERTVTTSVKETAYTVAAVPEEKQEKENSNYISIKSPIVGVFYAAPAENAAPYVKKGDQVKKGQTVCIVEAMKLMNEITAEEDGIISEICVTNGQVVEYGTELFKIEK